MSVTKSHSLSIGIVGLPNAGKSTLFNSLTRNAVPAENFPFTTIDKNIGVVEVPDSRLDSLETFFSASKRVPSAITFVDIAGLIKGASKGEGLGNQFLSHIREVDVVMYVLRCFESETISHVYERVDPFEDLKIVESELILKDLDTIQTKLGDVKKRNRMKTDKELNILESLLEKLLEWLNQGKSAIDFPVTDDEAKFMKDLWLLSGKKRLYILNVREGVEDKSREEWVKKFKSELIESDKEYVLEVDVKTLGEISLLEGDEREEFIQLLGFKPVTNEDVIRKAFDRLNLITFFTGSEKEVNAWSIGAGATVKAAAGVIHTDLAKGFITADVVNVTSMIEAGGMQQSKEKGLLRNQGKEYIVQDGDYIIIHAN